MTKKKNKKNLKDSSKTKKSTKKKKTKTYSTFVIAFVMIALVAYTFYVNKDVLFNPLEETLIIANVNGAEITLDEINDAYNRLPDEYKLLVTNEDILDEKITEILLLQEAEKQDITSTKEEATETINEAIKESEMSEEEFKERLVSLGVSRSYLDDYYRKQLIISKLLNETLFKKIIISDSEIEQFYENNELALQDITFEDSKEDIEELLLSEKKKSAYLAYLNQLKARADIEIFLDKPVAKTEELEAQNVFEETPDSICMEDDQPIIRLYSTTECQSCKWIKETFDSFAKEHQEQNEILAYHWELNTGDNTLTEEIEKGITKSELDIFMKYNPKSTVPTFIFGCKYIRIGNAYEEENNLDAEKKEFEIIINKLKEQ